MRQVTSRTRTNHPLDILRLNRIPDHDQPNVRTRSAKSRQAAQTGAPCNSHRQRPSPASPPAATLELKAAQSPRPQHQPCPTRLQNLLQSKNSQRVRRHYPDPLYACALQRPRRHLPQHRFVLRSLSSIRETGPGGETLPLKLRQHNPLLILIFPFPVGVAHLTHLIRLEEQDLA